MSLNTPESLRSRLTAIRKMVSMDIYVGDLDLDSAKMVVDEVLGGEYYVEAGSWEIEHTTDENPNDYITIIRRK
jgi:hypothetical protein